MNTTPLKTLEENVYLMLKEAAEECYDHNEEEKWSRYYKGMRDMAYLILPTTKIDEIDYNARAKFPKLLI